MWFQKNPYSPPTEGIFYKNAPPVWKFQLNSIHFITFFGLREFPHPQEIPIPSVKGWKFEIDVWCLPGVSRGFGGSYRKSLLWGGMDILWNYTFRWYNKLYVFFLSFGSLKSLIHATCLIIMFILIAQSCDHFGHHGERKIYLATKILGKVANWRMTDFKKAYVKDLLMFGQIIKHTNTR